MTPTRAGATMALAQYAQLRRHCSITGGLLAGPVALVRVIWPDPEPSTLNASGQNLYRNARQIYAIDLRTLAFFRLCLASLLLGDLADRAIDLRAHYTDAGVLPRLLLLDTGAGWAPSLHMASGSALFQVMLFLVAAVCAIALLVGYRTRIAVIACWFMTWSIQTRNPMILQGGDSLTLLLLLWAVFLPIGARFSVDAALAHGPNEASAVPDRSHQPQNNCHAYVSMATAAVLFQVMYVYFFGALLKTGDAWHADGTAVAMALSSDTIATPIGVWLREFPTLTQALTRYTWYLELLTPLVLLFPVHHLRLRLLMLGLLVLLHLGFFVLLKVGIFPFVSLTSLTVFIPAAFWDWLAQRRRPTAPVRIYYDQHCGFCLRVCLLLRTFLLLPNAPIEPAQSHPTTVETLLRDNSWVVHDGDGPPLLRWDAMVLLFARSPLFSPLAQLMRTAPVCRVGLSGYNWVAAHRGIIGQLSDRYLPFRRQSLRMPRLLSVIVAGLFVVALYANLARTPLIPAAAKDLVSPVVAALSMQQNWRMFAPEPPHYYEWFEAEGEFATGERVDMLHGRPPGSTSQPDDLASFFSRHRWRSYSRRVTFRNYEMKSRYFARYLCTRWNAQHPDARSVFNIHLVYVRRYVAPEPNQPAVERLVLVDEECGLLASSPHLVP